MRDESRGRLLELRLRDAGVALHSPLVLAYLDSRIYELSADSEPAEIDYELVETVRLTRGFLADRERFLAALLDDA